MPKAFYHYTQFDNTNSIVNTYTINDFHYNEYLIQKFDTLTKGKPCHDLCMSHLSYQLMSRAFYGRYFNSYEYKINCKKYCKMMRKSGHSKITKIMLILSSIGMYSIVFACYYSARQSYRQIKKCFAVIRL